jgi:hypothetical protein
MNLNLIEPSNLPDDSDFLWRYIDIHKLLSILNSKSIRYSRMDQFEDLLEGVPYETLVRARKLNIEGFNLSDAIANHSSFMIGGLKITSRIDRIIEIQKSHFVSCWFSQQRESMAMWNLYSNSDSVAIKIPFGKLKKYYFPILNNHVDIEYYCGRVSYQDFSNLNSDSEEYLTKMGKIGLRKDLSFSHEKEVRFIVKNEFNSKENIKGIESIPLNFNDVGLQVISHPKMSNWKKDNIKKLLASKKLKGTFQESEIKLRY